MPGYVAPIEKLTEANSFFRRVLFTARRCQLVVMSLLPREEIGMEVHPQVDQFFRIESGQGMVVMNGKKTSFKAGDAIIVQAGTRHNLINTSAVKKLKLYTIYCPPNHPDKKVHKTKAAAMADEHDHA